MNHAKTGLVASSEIIQDAAAFAIQEILAAKACSGSAPSEQGLQFWNSFKSDIQTVIQVFRTTSYMLSARVERDLQAAAADMSLLFRAKE